MAVYEARIKSKHDTTANWNATQHFVPLPGEIIIYDDYKTITVINRYGEEVTRNIPGIKIGTGNAVVQDLGFVDDELRDKLLDHIENQEMHLLLGERAFWNSKVDIIDDDAHPSSAVNTEGVLTFTRDDWKNYKG